jgi:predicted RNase H-like HicB family nuclease
MKPTRARLKEAAKRYLKVVEWSEEDGVFIGSAPPLVGQACHGETEAEVPAQLQMIVEEWVGILLSD